MAERACTSNLIKVGVGCTAAWSIVWLGRPDAGLVVRLLSCTLTSRCVCLQEVGFCHMRIVEGVNSRLQLSGLLAKLCQAAIRSR